jgi:hypothetical protein
LQTDQQLIVARSQYHLAVAGGYEVFIEFPEQFCAANFVPTRYREVVLTSCHREFEIMR